MKAVGDPWETIEYEVKMFYASYKKFFARSAYSRLPYVLKNALEESAVLHTRILCDIFLNPRKQKDDIILKDLLLGWPHNARYRKMKVPPIELKQAVQLQRQPCGRGWRHLA